jgi:hypothetical protein
MLEIGDKVEITYPFSVLTGKVGVITEVEENGRFVINLGGKWNVYFYEDRLRLVSRQPDESVLNWLDSI